VDRRAFVLAAAAVAIEARVVAAQQVDKVARIGYLSVSSVEADRSFVGAFRGALGERGYVEGKNLVIEQRHAAGHAERLPALVAELARLKVDVLVIYGAWHLANRLPASIPVVFTVVPDPVGQGLVASLARPGGNITGLTDTHAELVPKRLELIRQVAPAASRVAVLLYPNRMSLLQLRSAQAAAPAQGLTILPVEVAGPEPADIQRTFAGIERERAGVILVIGEPTVSAHRSRISEFAIEHRLPAVGTVREWAAAGFLLSYGANFHDLWRRAAAYVDRILKGAKPADLPVEQPTKFDLVVNLKTARAIGLTIAPPLLLRADEVIE